MIIYTLICALLFGWKMGFLFLFLFPFMSYASIKIMEEQLNAWNSTLPLAIYLLKKNFREICEEIKENRKVLQKVVREAVEELGPKMGKEFWENRVITQEEFSETENDNQQQQPKNIFTYKRRIYKVKEIDDCENMFESIEDIYSN